MCHHLHQGLKQVSVRLLQGGRGISNVKSYDQKCLKFENFTAQVQDDGGAPRMSALHCLLPRKRSCPTWVTSSNQAPSPENRCNLT
jgi:hypothetical protein